MLTKVIAGKRVDIPDSIDEMTALELQNFNKFLMKDSEVGSSFADVDARIQKTLEFLSKDMKEEAGQELDNMRILISNFYNNNEMPICEALASITRSVNGKAYDNSTAHGREEIMKALSGGKMKAIYSAIYDVKKKSILKLKSIFRTNPKMETK